MFQKFPDFTTQFVSLSLLFSFSGYESMNRSTIEHSITLAGWPRDEGFARLLLSPMQHISTCDWNRWQDVASHGMRLQVYCKSTGSKPCTYKIHMAKRWAKSSKKEIFLGMWEYRTYLLLKPLLETDISGLLASCFFTWGGWVPTVYHPPFRPHEANCCL